MAWRARLKKYTLSWLSSRISQLCQHLDFTVRRAIFKCCCSSFLNQDCGERTPGPHFDEQRCQCAVALLLESVRLVYHFQLSCAKPSYFLWLRCLESNFYMGMSMWEPYIEMFAPDMLSGVGGQMLRCRLMYPVSWLTGWKSRYTKYKTILASSLRPLRLLMSWGRIARPNGA